MVRARRSSIGSGDRFTTELTDGWRDSVNAVCKALGEFVHETVVVNRVSLNVGKVVIDA